MALHQGFAQEMRGFNLDANVYAASMVAIFMVASVSRTGIGNHKASRL